MTLPAEQSAESPTCDECTQTTDACNLSGCAGQKNAGWRARAEWSDSAKLTAILEQQVWLTTQVAGILQAAQRNPMVAHMMRKATR